MPLIYKSSILIKMVLKMGSWSKESDPFWLTAIEYPRPTGVKLRFRLKAAYDS